MTTEQPPCWHEPRPFQLAVAESKERVTFVRAGCGSGKTAAAYLWAAQRAAGCKLFFSYPTTGTASQGFEDYAVPSRAEAALMHSRASVDLERLLSNGHDATPEEEDDHRLEEVTKLASLQAWDKPLTICTVDTVLGLLQNHRTGLFSFPAIANAAFIFDEVHQYDEPLFFYLCEFLRTFRRVPILLMTASLPMSRLEKLQRILRRQGEELAIVDGPRELEEIARYHLHTAEVADAWEQVEQVFMDGGKVLWVCNTVDRARAITRAADARFGPDHVLPYHSRYRYGDRLDRHHAVITAFKPKIATEGFIAITTQVCEVSLDISATLLVTELAPVPALIQRLGRLNRFVTPEEPGEPAPAIVVEPEGSLPYMADDLALTRTWLADLPTGALSQARLASAFNQLVLPSGQHGRGLHTAWLEGGLLAEIGPIRQGGYTIPVIREEDWKKLNSEFGKQCQQIIAAGLTGKARTDALTRISFERRRQIISNTLPMPLRKDRLAGRITDGVLVAPTGTLDYDARMGGSWV